MYKVKTSLKALLLSYEIVKGFIVKNAFLSVVLAKNCSVDPLLYVITHLLKTMLRYKISLDLEFRFYRFMNLRMRKIASGSIALISVPILVISSNEVLDVILLVKTGAN